MIKYQKNDEEVSEYAKRHKYYITIIEDIICRTKSEKPRQIVPKASLLVDMFGKISIKTLIYGLNHICQRSKIDKHIK